MNFWKQQTHIMSYFSDNFRGDKRLPSSFMSGFLEVSLRSGMALDNRRELMKLDRAEIRETMQETLFCKYIFFVKILCQTLPYNAMKSHNVHIQMTLLCM